MYKVMLTMVSVLSFSQIAVADNSEVFKCIDSTSLIIQEECVENTFAKNSANDDFFAQIAEQHYESSNDAIASITYFPTLNLIKVKSLEPKNNTSFIASR